MERRLEHLETYWKDGERVAIVDEKDVWYSLKKQDKGDREELYNSKKVEV